MQLGELDDVTRNAVERVLAKVSEILDRADSPHLRAASHGYVPVGERFEDVLGGGSLSGPSRPPFVYDLRELTDLHRQALLASWRSERPIRNLIIRATRSAVGEPWTVDLRLVSPDEHQALRRERAAIDEAVEKELRGIDDVPAAWIIFGREGRKPPRLARKTKALEELEMRPSLLAHLENADKLYRARGLELVTLIWRLDPEMSIREYFE